MGIDVTYLDELKKRAKDSHIYRKYQLIGLEIAELLHDRPHKALYMKLAKDSGGEKLLALAKEVSERKGIKNKGAYFMKMLHTPQNNDSRNLYHRR